MGIPVLAGRDFEIDDDEYARAGADVGIASRKLEHLEPVAKEMA